MEIKIAIAVIYFAAMAVLCGLYVIRHCKAVRDAYENLCSYGERREGE